MLVQLCQANLLWLELPAAGTTMVGYGDGGWCGAPFGHGCEEPPAAGRAMMWYWLGLCVFPHVLDHFPFRKLQHSSAEWQKLCSGSRIQSCGCQRTKAATLHLHGEPLPPFLVFSQPYANAVHPMSPWWPGDTPPPCWATHATHPTVTWATPSVVTRPFHHQELCQEIMWGPASFWLPRVKGWQAPSAHGSGELPAACRTVMRYLSVLQSFDSSPVGEDRSILWSDCVPVCVSSCHAQEN